mgnify:CR=1 FL=1
MIKFGDNIDFSYVLKEVVESSIKGEYICPCDTTKEDCTSFSLNQELIDNMIYGPKSKSKMEEATFDEGDRIGGWLLYPSIPYRAKRWTERFRSEVVKLEIIIKQKLKMLDSNPD